MFVPLYRFFFNIETRKKNGKKFVFVPVQTVQTRWKHHGTQRYRRYKEYLIRYDKMNVCNELLIVFISEWLQFSYTVNILILTKCTST